MTFRLFTLVMLLLTAACGPGTDSDSRQDGAAESQVDTNVSARTDPQDNASADYSALALDTEGLRLVDSQSGSAAPVAFGMDRITLTNVLDNTLGEPAESGMNEDCGAGPLAFVSWGDGLTLWFSNDAFIGWVVDGRNEGAENYTTMSGIGTGSTRAELEGVYAVTVENTSLGVEFAGENIFGILDGPGQDAEITTIWSGTTCNFR